VGRLGHVPAKMHAWVPTWTIGEDEVLVDVMAGGVNYNGVWAGLGIPISPLDTHKNPYHGAGSAAAGIVWAIGAKVRRWKSATSDRPLQSGRRRRRGLQWLRSHAVAEASHLRGGGVVAR
jgi:NADPH:quinone reductase-like Zn-dependent oxidoreductase